MRFSKPFDKREFKLIKEVYGNLRKMIPDNSSILVGCSGGPDSVCLLLAIYYINILFKKSYKLHATYIDHGFRPECKEEWEFVRDLCGQLKIPTSMHKLNISREGNIMKNARDARLNRLSTIAEMNHSYLALAHNNDDQVETILMRVLGMCSSNNILGMEMETHWTVNDDKPLPLISTIIKPLLTISRSEIEHFVRDIKVVRDPTNNNTHYTRNLLRHEVIPYLEKVNPRLKEHLPALMERVRNYK